MLNVESLSFDLTDCSLREQSETHRGWMNGAGVAHRLQFNSGPPSWPFDLTDPQAATEFYRQQCADNQGVMLSMDVVTAAGIEVLRGIFKYRAPIPQSLAMYYVGILWVPFQKCNFQLNIEAMERGATGVREATVMVLKPDLWPKSDEVVVLKDGEDFFDRLRSAPVRQIPSDDEQFDHLFPMHPLSLVRARLAAVLPTLTLDVPAGGLVPFRSRRV